MSASHHTSKAHPHQRASSSSLLECAVYNGRIRMGNIRECDAGGFDALALDGVTLGHFLTIKQAADAVSRATGGVP